MLKTHDGSIQVAKTLLLFQVLLLVVILEYAFVTDSRAYWLLLPLGLLLFRSLIKMRKPARNRNNFTNNNNNTIMITTNKKQKNTIGNTHQSSLIFRKDDYALLISGISRWKGTTIADRRTIEVLQTELKKGRLVGAANFPGDVIRLNSRVRIKRKDQGDIIELVLVTPEKADVKEKRISVLAPIGTALIGFRQGDTVQWQIPAGKKEFLILDVNNEPE